MTLSTNSYGTVTSVASLVKRYSAGGTFSASTNPTYAQVERWIDQVSSLVNAILAEAGFTIPITDADVVSSCSYFVEEEVAAIIEGVNGSGRFGPTTKSGGGKGRFALLVEDVQAFVKANTVGFERMGATRSYSATSGLAYRDVDESGEETFPLFQRKGFGAIFTDWDNA